MVDKDEAINKILQLLQSAHEEIEIWLDSVFVDSIRELIDDVQSELEVNPDDE